MPVGGHHTRIKCQELMGAPPFQVCLLLKPGSHPTVENTGATSSLSVFLVTSRRERNRVGREEREEGKERREEEKGMKKKIKEVSKKGNQRVNKWTNQNSIAWINTENIAYKIGWKRANEMGQQAQSRS